MNDPALLEYLDPSGHNDHTSAGHLHDQSDSDAIEAEPVVESENPSSSVSYAGPAGPLIMESD